MNDDLFPKALLDPAIYPHPCPEITLCETHLSWVILTGNFAYKVKKPVRFDFADFSSLELRRNYCNEELRLNCRLAPDLYLNVVPITATGNGIAIGGTGTVIDYAVRMRQFPASRLLSELVATQPIPPGMIDNLADRLAVFHMHADVAEVDSGYGTGQGIVEAVQDNFATLRKILHEPWRSMCHAIETAVESHSRGLTSTFASRKRNGMVRECHGDLHLGNMFLDGDHVTVFDGIEFNDQFRWIDVISEIAFTVMDFDDRGQKELGWRFLNRWLERTGDYRGVAVLPYYICYRAMVRAKTSSLRAAELKPQRLMMRSLASEFDTYLHLAQHYANLNAGAVIITMGVSGSGKSYHSQSLVESLPAVRIRSDVERKRMTGVNVTGDSVSRLHDEIYTADSSNATYSQLLSLANIVVRSGLPVVIDATFLLASQRAAFRELADTRDVPFVILTFDAPLAVLERRIRDRRQTGGDPSDATAAVLRDQLQCCEQPGTDESPSAIPFTETVSVLSELRRRIACYNKTN
jgi:uncharacterized protein